MASVAALCVLLFRGSNRSTPSATDPHNASFSTDPADRGPSDDSLGAELPGLRDASAQVTPNELLAEAFEVAGELTASLPESQEAWFAAGRIYYAFNEIAKAYVCWESALRLKADFAEVLCSFGEAAWEHGDFEGAAKHLLKAIAVNPPVGRKKAIFLADSLMNLGKAPEAVTVLEESARELPLPPFGLSLLGQAYLESRRYADAASHFEKVLATDPDSAGDHFALARCYDKLGDPQKARKHRDQYARLKKSQLADIAGARIGLRKSDWADFYPVVRTCHVNAGKTYALHGKFDAAQKHWLRAVALDPPNPEPRALLAALYRQQGRPIDAVRVSGQSGVASPSAHAP